MSRILTILTCLLITSYVFSQEKISVESVIVYSPGEDDDHYVNNAVMTYFKGWYYCMWQSSAMDEDAPDTHVRLSRSRDGKRWSSPVVLAHASDSTFSSPGGWIVNGRELTAFINVLGDIKTGGRAYYMTSHNGRRWSQMREVMMDDSTPLDGIMEQDPHIIGGRIINAAHFKPGLKARPIYTDDLTGHGGWRIGLIEMENRGNQSRGIEPSTYIRPDGTIVMLFRDQASSFRKLASESKDMGETWTKPYLTQLIDSRSKQCAGNLPDGTAYIISNPIAAKDRTVLGIAFSQDGEEFCEYQILRSKEDLSEQKYKGKYKTLGYSYPKSFWHDGSLYVSYSENKEKVIITKITF